MSAWYHKRSFKRNKLPRLFSKMETSSRKLFEKYRVWKRIFLYIELLNDGNTHLLPEQTTKIVLSHNNKIYTSSHSGNNALWLRASGKLNLKNIDHSNLFQGTKVEISSKSIELESNHESKERLTMFLESCYISFHDSVKDRNWHQFCDILW